MKKPSSKRIRRSEVRVSVEAQPIDRAIMDFQILGKSDQLIKLFEPLLQQYVRLLYYQKIDYSSRQIRYFISYFMSDKEHRRQIRGNLFVSKQCREEAKRIVQSLGRGFGYEYEEEVLHELLLVLLKMAKDYQESGSGFEGFVYTYYSRYLKTYLISEDMKRSRAEPLLFARQYKYFQDEQEVLIHQSIFEDEYFSTEEEDDDLQWFRLLNGQDDSVFAGFTTVQRRILIMYYLDHKTDSEIAKEMAMHPGSVQRSRRKMYKKLWEQLKEGALKCSRLNQNLVSLDSFLSQEENASSCDAEMQPQSSEQGTCK